MPLALLAWPLYRFFCAMSATVDPGRAAGRRSLSSEMSDDEDESSRSTSTRPLLFISSLLPHPADGPCYSLSTAAFRANRLDQLAQLSVTMSSSRLPSKLSSLLVTVPNLSAAAQAKLGQAFTQVHSHPAGEGLTAEILAEVDMAFTTNRALSDLVRDFKETPNLKLVHLCSSGKASQLLFRAGLASKLTPGLPTWCSSLTFVGTTGADKAIASAAFAHQTSHPPADQSKAVTLCSASGIHVHSIPSYIIATWLASFHRLPMQLHFAKVRPSDVLRRPPAGTQND